MFSVLLGKDEDYIDKRKLDDELKTGSNFTGVNPPFVSEDNQFKGDKNNSVYKDDSFSTHFNAKLA